MRIRSSVVAPAVLAVVVAAASFAPAPFAAAQQAGAPAAGGSTEVLNDNILRALGIEREWLSGNEKLKTTLTEAIQKFNVGDGNGTLEKLGEAVKTDVSLPPAELLLARLLILINDINRGRQLLDQVASKNPDSPEVYLLLGNLALGEGRFTDAYLEYTQAGEWVGKKTNWIDSRRTNFLREVYSGKAAVFEQLQNWERAKNELLVWQEMNDQDPLVHLRKGRILYLEGVKPDEDDKKFDAPYNNALTELQEAYRLQKEAKEKGLYKNDPVIERPELVLLQLHTAANKFDRAREELKKLDADEKNIETNDPKEAGRIFTQVSIWHLRQGEFDEARTYATKATALDKESPALKALSAMLGYYSNDPKAEEDFAKMHVDAPSDFFSSNYLALILSESPDQSKRGRAVQLAEMNARLYPQSAEALSTLGWCYYNVGRYQEALKVMGVFTQGAQISPDTAYYFAKVLMSANNGATRDIINLLDSAIAAKGPFKHRRAAEQWRGALRGDVPFDPKPTTSALSTPAAGNTQPAKPPATP
jgi:tetratricopeptide (TPR) repeat protein